MALDESIDGLDKLESNGINAFIDPKLNEYLASAGDINIDFISNELGQSGYRVSVGENKCGDCHC
jgi:hypothetical protein